MKSPVHRKAHRIFSLNLLVFSQVKAILFKSVVHGLTFKEFGFMWRLLSGIALILVLDVVFIWIMASEPGEPEIARAVGPVAAVPVIHPQENLPLQQIEDAAPPTEFDDDIHRESTVSRVSKRYGPRQTSKIGTNTETTIAATPENVFPDRIIWIGRTDVPVDDEPDPVAIRSGVETGEEFQTAVTEERPTKNRSFQSKAIGVIKKPYTWIRALASQFD